MSLICCSDWFQQRTLATADLSSSFANTSDSPRATTSSDNPSLPAGPSSGSGSSSNPPNSNILISSYLYFYKHQASPYFMMRRASISARRRLNSHELQEEDPNGSTQQTTLRSRSQERSLNNISVKQQHEELLLPNHSQVSSTTGSEGGCWLGSSDQDPLDNGESHANARQHVVHGIHHTLMEGVVNPNNNQVIITNSPVRTPKKTSHKKEKGIPKSPKFHRRAQSDPFDIAGLEELLEDKDEAETCSIMTDDSAAVGDKREATTTHPSMPTLPRYPVAETRDLNCWSEPPLDIFRVRGPNYLKDKKKVASDPYLLRARGCDLFLFPTDDKEEPVTMMERSSSLLNGTLRKEPTLVLNFRFPWGLMLLYFEMPDSMAPFMKHVPDDQCYRSGNQTKKQQQHPLPDLGTLSPGERTLAQWIMGDTDYKNQRLKLIPYVVQGPWVVRSLVTGKPAIIGTKLPVTYQCQDSSLLVAELDIGNSSASAKRIVGVCRRYMNALTCDIGFVIQGNTSEELPEQMLGSIRIHGIDPLKAPPFV